MANDLIGLGKALEATAELTKEARQIIFNLLGPASQEAGKFVGDALQNLRFERTLKMIDRAKQLLAERGIKPQVVGTKIIVPLIQYCSLEDDEDLTFRWAGLLASAVSGEELHSSYPRLLAELTPLDARILDQAYDQKVSGKPLLKVDDWKGLDMPDKDQLRITMDNLYRLRLLAPFLSNKNWPESQFHNASITPLGVDFVQKCRGPQSSRETTRSGL